MDNREYEIVEGAQESHWWWLGRQRIIESWVRKYCYVNKRLDIAEVGSGFGANIPMLCQFGEVTALELNDDARTRIRSRWGASGHVKTLRWLSPEPVDGQ